MSPVIDGWILRPHVNPIPSYKGQQKQEEEEDEQESETPLDYIAAEPRTLVVEVEYEEAATELVRARGTNPTDPEWDVRCDGATADENFVPPGVEAAQLPDGCSWVHVGGDNAGSHVERGVSSRPPKEKGKLYTHKQLWGERRMRRGEMGIRPVGVVG